VCRLLPADVKKKIIYKTIIFYVHLYVCETWPLTLREEYRLRVFENRVMRRIFGPKTGKMSGDWSKLLNEELLKLQSSLSIIRMTKKRRMRWAGNVALVVE
jgi:hypothetical protein